MITRNDPRHIARQKALQELFSWNFQHQSKLENELSRETVNHLEYIDQVIEECAPEFPKERINHIDLSVLRLAVYELLVKKTEPMKVIIDEAVELAKEFGGDGSPAFVNGALGKAVTKL